MENKRINLERFLNVHEMDYELALREIKNGRKETHWMWYIFPQITGLGMSETAKYYEITNALLALDTNDPVEIFGNIDALKLKSSMTLFYYV